MSLHRLLLVEDDADMAAMLAAYLQRHGLHVTRADSRATALAALRGGRVDLILLDVSLGDDDGVAICAEIREAQDVPIYHGQRPVRRPPAHGGYEVGADDYIAKPFNPTCCWRASGGAAPRGPRAQPVAPQARPACCGSRAGAL